MRTSSTPPPPDGPCPRRPHPTTLAACPRSLTPALLRRRQVPVEFAVGTLRLSTGRHTTAAEVDAAAQLILSEARRQGALLPR